MDFLFLEIITKVSPRILQEVSPQHIPVVFSGIHSGILPEDSSENFSWISSENSSTSFSNKFSRCFFQNFGIIQIYMRKFFKKIHHDFFLRIFPRDPSGIFPEVLQEIDPKTLPSIFLNVLSEILTKVSVGLLTEVPKKTFQKCCEGLPRSFF